MIFVCDYRFVLPRQPVFVGIRNIPNTITILIYQNYKVGKVIPFFILPV